MVYSPAIKDKVHEFYLTGDYENIQEICNKFGVKAHSVREWIRKEKWEAEKNQVWKNVRELRKPIEDRVLERQQRHLRMWDIASVHVIDAFQHAQKTKKKLKPADINSLCNAMDKIQKGQRLADGATEEGQEKSITLIYKGLQESLEEEEVKDMMPKPDPKILAEIEAESKRLEEEPKQRDAEEAAKNNGNPPHQEFDKDKYVSDIIAREREKRRDKKRRKKVNKKLFWNGPPVEEAKGI